MVFDVIVFGLGVVDELSPEILHVPEEASVPGRFSGDVPHWLIDALLLTVFGNQFSQQ